MVCFEQKIKAPLGKTFSEEIVRNFAHFREFGQLTANYR